MDRWFLRMSRANLMNLRAVVFFCVASTSAFAAPHIQISAKPSARELFVEQRLQQAVAGLPGDEQILLATRLDPLLKAERIKISTYDNRIRISPSVYNDMDDVERLLKAVSRA